MKVLSHPDPLVVEAELLDRVEAVQGASATARVLVLVPGARLADHLRRRLVLRRPACLGVEVEHYRGLIRRALARCDGPLPRLASANLVREWVRDVLKGLATNPLARYVRSRPGAVGALAASLEDLRDAGLTPREVQDGATEGFERAMAELYAAWCRRLEDVERVGLLDEPGLCRRAAPAIGDIAAPFAEVLHHGAYELTGAHLDLLRRIDAVRPVTVFLVGEPGAPVHRFAERFAVEFLLPEGATIERIADRVGGVLGRRLSVAYDEPARPDPIEDGAVRFRHAQGAAAEFTTAVLDALARVGEGADPTELAVVARDLEPYALAIEPALDDLGIPFTTSLAAPLRRDPRVRDLVGWLRAAAADFPRGATAELLSSSRVRWEALAPGLRAPDGDAAEAWSRRAALVGGVRQWTEDLPRWIAGQDGSHAEGARRLPGDASRRAGEIAAAIGAVVEAFGAGGARSWSGHADVVRGLASAAFGIPVDETSGPDATEEGDEAAAALATILDDMKALDAWFAGDRAVPFASMADWLESAVDSARIGVTPREAGGPRVLDVMQARGLTFRHLAWIGWNQDAFPAPAREDPFLSDGFRSRLRGVTGKPLPVKGDSLHEERYLLALIAGSAAESLDISWQRADDTGATRSPSMGLREMARLTRGVPDLAAVVGAAEVIPADPEARLVRFESDPGLLDPESDRLLSAFRASSRAAGRTRFAEAHPDLASAVRTLDATESFDGAPREFDGRVPGTSVRSGSWTVSALARLGRCPLQFFFRDVLRVFELEEPARESEIAAWDLGSRVHRLLERLYRRLHLEELFSADREDELLRRAEILLDSTWEGIFGDLEARTAARFPLLVEAERERWRSALLEFVRSDLRRLVAGGWVPVGFEESRTASIDVGKGSSIAVAGRLDRILGSAGGLLVGDYKTSGSLGKQVNPSNALKAEAIEAPLYQFLAGDGADVELLGVGPAFSSSAELSATVSSATLPRLEGDLRAGFVETLGVLAALIETGRFPLAYGHHCDWCAHRAACRRTHPPTRAREAGARDTEAFRLLGGKSKRSPWLANVDVRSLRSGTDGEAEET